MDEFQKIQEKFLYEIWERKNYNSELKTISGEEIEILDTGIRNPEYPGPDFKNARIRIGNLTYVGDIEIDKSYSDWKLHGHNIDLKYSSVVLHASLFNKNNYGFVYTRSGRKIHSICLQDYIDKDFLENVDEADDNERHGFQEKLKCAGISSSVDNSIKEHFISQIGVDCFQKKCNKLFERLKEIQHLRNLKLKEPVIGYDLSEKFHRKDFNHLDFESKIIWQQLFYELIFEALGYSKNKKPMNQLTQAANLDLFTKIEKDGVLIEKYEAALLFIGGLAQTINSVSERSSVEYIERVSLHWNAIKPFYDGQYLDETQWNFFRLRPQNFPTIRLAGGVRLLNGILNENLIGVIAKKIDEIHNYSVLVNSIRSLFIIKADGFWKRHYVFDHLANTDLKYFIGVSRADEIMVNVVLPFFAVYFEVFGKPNLAKKVLKLYNLYVQKSDNQIIKDVSDALNMSEYIKKTIISQGMIELFRSYCSKNRCLECEIGKIIFN